MKYTSLWKGDYLFCNHLYIYNNLISFQEVMSIFFNIGRNPTPDYVSLDP